MKVAIISDLIRPNGAGVMALLGAQLLQQHGHEVVVLAGSISAELERTLRLTHAGAAGFTQDERALDGSVTATDHQRLLRAFHAWLDAALDEHQPDVLSVHNCGRVLSQLELVKLSHRVPLAYTMHDEWFFTDAHYTYVSRGGGTVRTYEPGRAESLIEHRYDHLFDVPSAAGVFAALGPSRWITERARRVFPTLDIHHVPNPVDSALFDLQDRAESRAALGLPSDMQIVLFVGSPTQDRKGLDRYEAAMRELDRTDRPVLRLIAGGSGSVAVHGAAEMLAAGPLLDRVDAFTPNPVGALGLGGPGVVVAGLDRTLMPAVYGAADVLVHPSRIDNLPTVPIEAGLCGTRCLASDVGGTAETIVDASDLFPDDIEPGDLASRISGALADAASETLDDREHRRQVQIERFSETAHMSTLLPVLESLADRGSANA